MAIFVNGVDCTIDSVTGKPTKVNPYLEGVFESGNYHVFHLDIAQYAMYQFNCNVQITLFDGTGSIDAVSNEGGIRFISYSFPCKKIDNFDLKK